MAPSALGASANDLVTQLSVAPASPNILQAGQDVTLSFNYKTTELTGVRIFARPFSGGALTPSYAAHGSPVYPTGSGTGTGSFTISSGNVTVDQIRFQMWNANQTTMLNEVFVPVHYRFTSATTDAISRIGPAATPNVLKFKQKVKIAFRYTTAKPAGVRIFVRPLSGDSPTRNYAASASPLYATGAGSGTGWFTVTKGATTVTKVRVTMWNAAWTKLLFKADFPVSYMFRSPTNIVNSIKLAPKNANLLLFGENVGLTFKYTTNRAGGVRIFARPFTSGSLTPNYAAHASRCNPIGTGSATGSFTISSGAVRVDQIRIQMWNADQPSCSSPRRSRSRTVQLRH